MENANTINRAVEEFEKQTGIDVQVQPPTPNEREVDGILKFTHNKEMYEFYIETKKELRNYQIPDLENLNKKYHPLIVIGEYIFPKIKDELRKQNIAYLETNGNVYMKEKNLFFWMDIKKPTQRETEKKGRAFTKTGLKLVFQFLLYDDLVNRTYREIADWTGIGFGNINFIINDLEDQGFLIEINKTTYQLTRKKELMNKWMEAYKIKLKPALQIGRFRFAYPDNFINWKRLPLKNKETQWGGEPAGDMLTDNLMPEELTIYTTEKRNDIIPHYGLIPDDKGNVKVYEKFWIHDDANLDIAPPLLVYADLMNTGDRRCIETAQKIYNELLQDKF
jgi:hypothetical protein